MVSVRWTGAAGLEFAHDGVVYLMDPYVSRPGKTAVFFKRLMPRREEVTRFLAGLPGVLKGVMIGHTHFDHALDIPSIAESTTAPIIGSQSLDVLLNAFGLPGRVTVCRGSERVVLDAQAAVSMLPGRHGRVLFGRIPYPGEIAPPLEPPLKAREYRLGQVFNMLLELGGLSFLHVGSADVLDASLEGRRCDVLFVCVAGWKRSEGFPARVLSRVRPKTVVPFHFDDFTVPLEPGGVVPDLPLLDRRGFLEQVAAHAPQAEIIWPSVNKVMTF